MKLNKKILYILIIVCSLLSVRCSSNNFVEYPHEYVGIVEQYVKTSSVVIGGYARGRGKIVYQVNCSKNDSAFNKIIFNQKDGDENFELFLMENVGKKVKIKVNVITREGNDHEASYGSFEIIDYEVINE